MHQAKIKETGTCSIREPKSPRSDTRPTTPRLPKIRRCADNPLACVLGLNSISFEQHWAPAEISSLRSKQNRIAAGSHNHGAHPSRSCMLALIRNSSRSPAGKMRNSLWVSTIAAIPIIAHADAEQSRSTEIPRDSRCS